jgi:hypothetical protein
MTKLISLARARVIGPVGGAEDGAAGAGVGEGAAGVDVLMVSSSLGHFNFYLLSRLSRLGLVLPKLKYQKELVCAPCRHGKMVAASHPPLTSVMIERPCELFHMDLVGPARVCSASGKWYFLVIVWLGLLLS